MKKKMRKFAEGGSSIDEGTRERARKWMEEGSPEQDTGGKDTPSRKPTPKAEPKAETKAESKAETAEEHKERMDKRIKEQGIERVEPENYIPGAGMLKPMLKKAVEMGAKRTAKEAAEGAAKNATRKAEEGFNPSEALDALKPTRTVSVKGKDIPVKQGKPNLGKSTEGMGVKEATNKSGKKIPVKRAKEEMADDGGSGAFKRGGSVRMSASKRADGCAIRGKTRA